MKKEQQKMTKEKFLEIQSQLWDASPSYPDELTKDQWLEVCGKFYDEHTEIFN